MTHGVSILESDDFKRCVAFHGHVCPGLAIGYRAAQVALASLNATRSEDEEIVAVVETDACSADAVQVLTGCTFGKGNFIYKDYGKMVLTLFSRATGRGIRVALRADGLAIDAEHAALREKVMTGTCSSEERRRFDDLHLARSRAVLETPADKLFDSSEVESELPPKARMEPSRPCARCGEPTMPSKMVRVDGRTICRACQ